MKPIAYVFLIILSASIYIMFFMSEPQKNSSQVTPSFEEKKTTETVCCCYKYDVEDSTAQICPPPVSSKSYRRNLIKNAKEISHVERSDNRLRISIIDSNILAEEAHKERIRRKRISEARWNHFFSTTLPPRVMEK